MDCDNGIPAVVFAAKHLLDFAGFDLAGQRVEPFAEFRQGTGIALFGPLDENGKIVTPPAQACDKLAVLLEPASTLQKTLCRFLILPEIWRGNFRFNLFQLLVGFCRLKDSSVDPPPV
jgi:hypothetical protein